MSLEVVTTRALLVERLDADRAGGVAVGFVPTMGYLHEGHGSLVDASVAATDQTVVSVFVNPLQFGPGEDLEAYPRDFDADLALCEARGAALVFHPTVDEVENLGGPKPLGIEKDASASRESQRACCDRYSLSEALSSTKLFVDSELSRVDHQPKQQSLSHTPSIITATLD